MRHRPLGSVALAIVVPLATQLPDFSGKWTGEPSAADSAARAGRGGRAAGPGDMGSGWGPEITITQDAKQLVVEFPFFARGDMQPPLRFTYALDGSDSRNTVLMGHGAQTTTARTAWQGAKLVITTTHTFRNPQTGEPAKNIVTRTLTLETPTTLVVETVYGGALGGPATTTRTVYRKTG
jgi:hypothetical protein